MKSKLFALAVFLFLVGLAVLWSVYAIKEAWTLLIFLVGAMIIVNIGVWSIKTVNNLLGGWLARTFPNYEGNDDELETVSG